MCSWKSLPRVNNKSSLVTHVPVALIGATDSRATVENKLRPRMLRCPVGDLPGSLALTGMTQRRTAESSGSSSEARRLRPHRGLENSSILGSSRGRWTADGDGVCCHSPITTSSSSSSFFFFFLRFLFCDAGELQRNEPTAISRARRTGVQSHHTHTAYRNPYSAKDSGASGRGGFVFDVLPSGPPRKLTDKTQTPLDTFTVWT